MENQKNNTPKLVSAIAFLALAGGITYAAMNNKTGAPAVSLPATTTAAQNNTTTTVVPSKVATVYKDGAYSATGSYNSPAGSEIILVALTIKNDIVTDATVTPQAKNPASKNFQNAFIAGFKTYVVGKNIATIKLSKVSGSSLTPDGFNNALATIKAQAKA